MGKVQQAAGGSGKTAQLVRTFVTHAGNNGGPTTFDVKEILPNYKDLTVENFVVSDVNIATSSYTWPYAPSIVLGYDSDTGILTCSATCATGLSWNYNVYCYYVS